MLFTSQRGNDLCKIQKRRYSHPTNMTAKKKYYLLPNDRHLYVSARIWHEASHKVRLAPFLYKLYEEIDFESYGKGLYKYYFTFIITRPQNKLHQPGRYFGRKRRALEVAIRLPYDEVFNASEPEIYRMLEAAYLEGIDEIGKVKLKEPFDHEAFKADVAKIFEDENWYVDAVPEPTEEDIRYYSQYPRPPEASGELENPHPEH